MRQFIDGGGWFETDAAEKYEEETDWNGNNHISRATGSQWDHQALYRTSKGRWVLYHSSQWQGSLDRWERISDEEAVAWLIQNEHEVPDDLAELAERQEV